MKIEPGAWFHPQRRQVPAGYEIKWKVLPMFADNYAPPKDVDETPDEAATLAQGIPNEKHTLEIVVDGKPAGADPGDPRLPAAGEVRGANPVASPGVREVRRDRGSAKGRRAGFEPANEGSIPSPRTP